MGRHGREGGRRAAAVGPPRATASSETEGSNSTDTDIIIPDTLPEFTLRGARAKKHKLSLPTDCLPIHGRTLLLLQKNPNSHFLTI